MDRKGLGWVKIWRTDIDEINTACGYAGISLWTRLLIAVVHEVETRWIGTDRVTVRPGQLLTDLNTFFPKIRDGDALKIVAALKYLRDTERLSYQQNGGHLFVKIHQPHLYIPEIPEDLPDQEFQKITKAKPAVKREPDPFFRSREWRELRYRVLRDLGAKCRLCGLTPENGVSIHVDHIKPRSKFPTLALEYSNMQVLCESCNLGKGNWDQSDFRKIPQEALTQ